MKDLAHVPPRKSATASGGAEGTVAPATDAAQVRHLRVTEAYAGQRVDNFLIRESLVQTKINSSLAVHERFVTSNF